ARGAPSCRSVVEHLAQRGEQGRHVAGPGGVAHAPDAPHLPGVGAEATADLDAVALEEQRPRLGLVEPLGHEDGRQLGETVAVLGEQLEPEALEPLLQEPAALGVAVPGVLQPLVEHGAEAGVTESTSSSASPLPAPSGSMSLRTPVDVSACTTAMIVGDGWASSRRCGSMAMPHSASTRTTSAPQRDATSHMRSPNTPFTPIT